MVVIHEKLVCYIQSLNVQVTSNNTVTSEQFHLVITGSAFAVIICTRHGHNSLLCIRRTLALTDTVTLFLKLAHIVVL